MLPFPSGYEDNKSVSSDLEDLENKINRSNRNLETLKKIVEDLYVEVQFLKDKINVLEFSNIVKKTENNGPGL